jgi:molybdopterin/thiamine biosynthesis adenylyltransferase
MTLALLPSSIATAIAHDGAWGFLDLRHDQTEDLLVVDGYSEGERVRRHGLVDWVRHHYSANVASVPNSGVWYRADVELHNASLEAAARHVSVTIDAFRSHVRGMRAPDRNGGRFAITVAISDKGEIDFAGWVISAEAASRFPVEVVDETADLFAPLGGGWPREALDGKLLTVVGCGSIGSAAAEALSAYAVRNIALVDPDHLQQRNLARHRLLQRDLGRLKVNALADTLTDRDDELTVHRYPFDVIADADVMRPLFAESACILVCSDGVASRRAANHLACRAGVPAVFACVLENGGIGELLRVLPHRTACLLCSREQLLETGAMDPEPRLDRGYAEGGGHLPMTAVGGDLDIVGRLAARVAISTLLVQDGYALERPPGDHAVIGLRPPLDLAPPFDVTRTGEIKWHPLGAPAVGCPSCGKPT